MLDRIDAKHVQGSVTRLLSEVAKQLALFLENILPSLSPDWWQRFVKDSLSFQQRRRVEQCHEETLSSLDLAALLRVLDRNWFQIAPKLNLAPEARHFVKEMQTVRNRWAHSSTEALLIEDVYRDLDTLQRFAAVINADEGLLHEARATKVALLAKEVHVAGRGEPALQQTTQVANAGGAHFEPGQIVFLKSNPSIKGAVVSVLPGKPENHFKVFVAGDTQTYYESQLQAEDRGDEELRFLPCEHFHAYLTALQIRYQW